MTDDRLRSITGGRPPGLDGTYSETCIACFTATDTALRVEGSMEWQAAFLVTLGVPVEQAAIALPTGFAPHALQR